MTRIATSTWSLHRTLGASMYQWSDPQGEPVLEGTGQGDLTLLELPAQLAARGIGLLEICHFHFPRLDDDYINQLRRALADSGVELFSVLIDAGDIAHPDAAQRAKEVAWVREWMEIAARCGAQCVRVIAGEGNDGEAVQVSAENLRAFASFGRTLGIGVMTENFRTLGTSVGALNAVLDLCDGEVGCALTLATSRGRINTAIWRRFCRGRLPYTPRPTFPKRDRWTARILITVSGWPVMRGLPGRTR